MDSLNNNISYEDMYNSIIPSLDSFLKLNNDFNLSKEELKTEIMYILAEYDIEKYDAKELLKIIRKELINKFSNSDSIPVSDSVSSYLRDIGTYKLLSPEEEIEYFNRYKNGDLEAKQEIIKRNLKLVVSIAKSYARFYTSFLDTIQEGNVGLIRAVEKFDPSMGNKFSTYATWWIKQSIQRAIANKGSVIKIPEKLADKLSKMKRVENKYIIEHGDIPTNAELANLLDTTEEEINELKSINFTYKSMNEKVNDESETEIGVSISSSEDIEENVIKSSLSEEIYKFFKEANLTNDQIQVLIYRYGLNGQKELTLEQTGKLLKRSKDRIRQIEMRALLKLRKCSYKDNIINYYDEKYDTEKVKQKTWI